MCGGGADETQHGLRVFEGRWADGYIGRYPVRPGYAFVVFKGRHVAEPGELSAEETAGFWSDVACVAQAVEDIAGFLDQADKLVSSVGNSRLQDLLRETFKAFNGSGPELARLIQSSRLLIDEANANYGQVTQLIDQGPEPDG